MAKTIEQVKQLAYRYGVPKLVLFGSRARGDHHARSDYDFAVWGCTPQQRAQFSDAVENDLDSLYSVDLVFVSEHTDAALLQNIEKDGIEGNTLTEKQTASLYDTGTLTSEDALIRAKDIEEMTGHFLMFNKMLKT